MRITRNERMARKNNKTFPVSVVAVNFQLDGNLGFITRAAACFGAKEVVVIGHFDNNKRLRELSANTSLLTRYINVRNPNEFLEYVREKDGELISIELGDDSVSIHDFRFNPKKHTFIVVGNETTGVPAEISHYSKNVFIPMPGFCPCLNTSQAAHVALYEYAKQMSSN